jgi:hypothetical protein
VLLGGFTAFSVFGYWNFALHPERLPGVGWALDFFTVSFQFFAQLHIVLAALVLGVVLVRQLGWRWWPALVGSERGTACPLGNTSTRAFSDSSGLEEYRSSFR